MSQELIKRQGEFSRSLGLLLSYAATASEKREYLVALAWSYRDEEANRRVGGHPKSTHLSKLAQDIDVFRLVGGQWIYQRHETPFHKQLGVFWEGLGGSWGGRFGDSNHFSMEWGGVR